MATCSAVQQKRALCREQHRAVHPTQPAGMLTPIHLGYHVPGCAPVLLLVVRHLRTKCKPLILLLHSSSWCPPPHPWLAAHLFCWGKWDPCALRPCNNPPYITPQSTHPPWTPFCSRTCSVVDLEALAHPLSDTKSIHPPQAAGPLPLRTPTRQFKAQTPSHSSQSITPIVGPPRTRTCRCSYLFYVDLEALAHPIQ